MRRHFALTIRSLALLLSSLAFALTTGCTADVLLLLTPRFGPIRVAGAASGAATVVPRLNGESLVPFGIVPNPAARQISALDLATSAVSKIADIEGASAADIISSADWVAWLDRIGGALHVLSRATSAVTEYSAFDATSFDLSLRALNGDRLVLHRPVLATLSSYAPQYEFVVLHLRSGAQAVIADSWAAGTCALDGDWLALINDKNVDVELLGLEFAANIDLVNLATDERTRIASDIRISGSEPAVFIADGRVFWQEFNPGKFSARLRVYDIPSAKLSTLIEDFAGADEDKMLAGVRDGRLLITRVRGNFLKPETITILSQQIGGSDLNVLGQYDSPKTGWYMPEARLTDGYATWTDPTSGKLTAYEFSSGETRTFALP